MATLDVTWANVILTDGANMDVIETYVDEAVSSIPTGQFLQAALIPQPGAHGIRIAETPEAKAVGHSTIGCGVTLRVTDSTDAVENDNGGNVTQSVSPTGHASFNLDFSCAGSAQDAPFLLEIRMNGQLKYSAIWVGKGKGDLQVPVTMSA